MKKQLTNGDWWIEQVFRYPLWTQPHTCKVLWTFPRFWGSTECIVLGLGEHPLQLTLLFHHLLQLLSEEGSYLFLCITAPVLRRINTGKRRNCVLCCNLGIFMLLGQEKKTIAVAAVLLMAASESIAKGCLAYGGHFYSSSSIFQWAGDVRNRCWDGEFITEHPRRRSLVWLRAIWTILT